MNRHLPPSLALCHCFSENRFVQNRGNLDMILLVVRGIPPPRGEVLGLVAQI
jgi:hypothetical protein